ncbi:hypothetical protein [Mycobacterium sp. AZCC_0083]|nr:hypothetical protein [Mycobacterium sp. AZCC_0083]MBB5166395.1 S-formylglutathione hydrolase FrmB [Mycobacterium sp. AZCC_0083]
MLTHTATPPGNIGCALHVYTGYHTWQFGARAFSDALPWIAQQV